MIAVIPARGGSRRIPRKNIKPFGGKPMIAWPIEAARESRLFDEVYVSTEDDEISAIAQDWGARPIKRSAHLARDEIGTQEVMRSALMLLDAAVPPRVCCIYPCTPLLRYFDLIEAHDTLVTQRRGYVVAVGDSPLRDIGWFYFGLSSCFAAGTPLYGHHTGLYVVDERRAIDINNSEDWNAALKVFQGATP